MITEKIQLRAWSEKAADGRMRIVASDETMDRSGESIPFESWDLSNFQKSPRLLIDHDYRVQAIVGKAEDIAKDTGRRALIFSPVFHDITQAARETKEMVDQGFLDTVSVGFLRKTDEAGVRRNELMEISFVAVPSNPSSRPLAVKAVEPEEEKAIKDFIGEETAAPEPEVVPEPEGEPEPKPEEGQEPEGAGADEPKADEPEEKGMIEDVNEAHEQMVKVKRQYVDRLFNCLFSFTDAYFSDAVLADRVGGMVDEMCQNMKDAVSAPIADMPEDDMPMMEGMKKLADRLGMEPEEKAGKVLSAKNREVITAARDTMQSGIVALDDLLAATEPSEGDAGKANAKPEAKGRKSHGHADDSFDKFVELRRVTRAVNTAISEALRDAKL
jgi:hypothetical protein